MNDQDSTFFIKKIPKVSIYNFVILHKSTAVFLRIPGEIDETDYMKGFLLFLVVSTSIGNDHFFQSYLQLDHSLPNRQLLFSLDDDKHLLVFLPLQHYSDAVPIGATAFKTLRVLRLKTIRIPNPWNLLLLQQIAGKALYPDMTGPIRIVVDRPADDQSYLGAVRNEVLPVPALGKQVQVLEDVLDIRYKGSTFAKVAKMSLTADFLRRGLAVLNREAFSEKPILLSYYEGLEKRARDMEIGIWNRLHLAAIQKRSRKFPTQP